MDSLNLQNMETACKSWSSLRQIDSETTLNLEVVAVVTILLLSLGLGLLAVVKQYYRLVMYISYKLFLFLYGTINEFLKIYTIYPTEFATN